MSFMKRVSKFVMVAVFVSVGMRIPSIYAMDDQKNTDNQQNNEERESATNKEDDQRNSHVKH